jgi:hypothetical protein
MSLLEKLLQMRTRLRGKEVSFPPGRECPDTQVHLAGVFLRAHLDEIIEAVKSLDAD